jgi:putative spermidine/putrescine transport system permease protein
MTTRTIDQLSAVRATGAPAARVGLGKSQGWLAAPSILWMALFLIGPLLAVVWFSFWTSESYRMIPEYTTENYSTILGDETFWSMLRWTVGGLMVVLAGVTLLGFPVAYFVARMLQREWVRTAILFAAIIPFWVSYVIRMITWIPIFGRNGLLNDMLTGIGILDRPADVLLYSGPAMLTAMIFLYVVFMIGPVYFKLLQIDPDLLRASQNLGASPWKTFRTVELPLIRPGIVAGWLFTSIMVINDFATERIVGGGLSPMLSGTIWRRGQLLLWPQASAQAVVLVIVAFVIVGVLLRISNLREEL